jgi:hypothetical protein
VGSILATWGPGAPPHDRAFAPLRAAPILLCVVPVKTVVVLASCLMLLGCTDRTLGKSDPIGGGDGIDAAPGTYPDGSAKTWDAPVKKWDAAVADAYVKQPDAAARPDAAVADAGTCSQDGEKCQQGTTRYCDGNEYCYWGEQTCGPDGQWGACNETAQAPAGCSGPAYSPNCCVQHNYCCELMDGTGRSAGNCPGVVPACHYSGGW